MIVGVPKEVKDHEYRVGMVPAGVHEMVAAGHEVLVEIHSATADSLGSGAVYFPAPGAGFIVRKEADTVRRPEREYKNNPTIGARIAPPLPNDP